MKKLLISSVVFFIAGCSSITFDSLNYDRYLTLYELSNQMKTQCEDPVYIRSYMNEIKPKIDHMALYSKLRSGTPEVAKVAATVASLVDELGQKYQDDKTPSVGYCREKLESISAASYTIASTLGAQQ